MRTSPRLSVILCTYNRCNLVLSTLASLRRQTLAYTQFEVIVVDNGSTDGTFQAVRTYVSAGMRDSKKAEDIWQVHWLSEPQHGLAYARNTALQAASGEIAVFLDDDTLAEPHWLERLLTAYEETGADAIGGCVELRWEATRPYWLTDDLLTTLGYFAPAMTRTPLEASTSFSNSNFSVKIAALHAVGCFSPRLSKRPTMPICLETHDLCRRLREANYTLWYEPTALVTHRILAARLTRPFFLGRAYWQGRSEVLQTWLPVPQTGCPQEVPPHLPSQGTSSNGVATWAPGATSTLVGARNGARGQRSNTGASRNNIGGSRDNAELHAAYVELRETISLALIHRPLLVLAGRSANERFLAALEQARSWGRLRQHLEFLKQPSIRSSRPAVLLVRSAEPDLSVEVLVQSLTVQDVDCTVVVATLSLSWLWQHRAQQRRIVHFHRPGAFNLNFWQPLSLYVRLWLARCCGVHIVTTDAGGWWQSTKGLHFLSRRLLERTLLRHSDLVLAYTHQPEQLYPGGKQLHQRVKCLPHPGLRGYYPPAMPRTEARKQLGLPNNAGFVYLCLANSHTEQELVLLIEAFLKKGGGKGAYVVAERSGADIASGVGRRERMSSGTQWSGGHSERSGGQPKGSISIPQLLLAGMPGDTQTPTRLLTLAALNPTIHLSLLVPSKEHLPCYMGAANAVVLPHFAIPTAGNLETALLGLSYERLVIVPNLPRFRGMLPPRASLLYDPTSEASLVRVLAKAQTYRYRLSQQELAALEAESGWRQYALRLLKLYP